MSRLPRLRPMARALAHRNFRLFFAGQGISLVGTWMQQVALSWLVYRMTGSAFLLGLVSCAGQVPTLFLAPLAGVVTDRYSRRSVLLVTQALIMLQALVTAALVLSGSINIQQLLVLSLFVGFVNPFDVTARQAFLRDLVTGTEDVDNAIAWNSVLFNAACLIGPVVAGVTIILAGEGLCFLFNAISFLAVLAALAAIRIPPRPASTPSPLARGLSEGVHYAFRFTPVRSVLLLLALVNLLGAPYAVLLPVFASDVLHGGPHTLGWLTSATGLGALLGSLYLAGRSSLQGIGARIAAAPAVFGLALLTLGLSHALPLSLVVLLAVGFAQLMHNAGSNVVLQRLVDEDKRGRVMSLYTLAIVGMAPLGSLLTGLLADRIGAQPTVMLGAPFCLVGSVLFAIQLPHLRRRAIRALTARGETPLPRMELAEQNA